MNTLLIIRPNDDFNMIINNSFTSDWKVNENKLRRFIKRVEIYNFSGTERLVCKFCGYRLVDYNGVERKRIYLNNIIREDINIQWYSDLNKRQNPIAYANRNL